MLLILSELPFFLLVAGKGKTPLLISTAILSVILGVALIIQNKKRIQIHFGIEYPLLTGITGFFFATLFYLRWNTSGRITTLADIVHMPTKQACILITLLLTILSLQGISNLIKIFFSLFDKRYDHNFYQTNAKFIVIFIAFTTILVLFLNSRNSPFYPFNTWVDPNTMFTVGKGVLKGYVPYRDLYEQKGPLLIFIHTFGAVVSYDTFIGIWFLELIACFAFLILIYKITSIYFSRNSIIIVPLTAVIIYSCKAFKAGDLAEEYSLPFLAYTLYLGIKALETNDLPSKQEFFLIGVTSGCVFWMKYSLVGLYIGWFISLLFYAILKQKLKIYIRGILLLITGVSTITMPIILYFILNSAEKDLFRAYFYNNIFYYANNQFSFTEKMLTGISYCERFIPVPLIISLLGLLWTIIHKKWKLLYILLLSFTGMYIFVFIGGVNHIYTSFDLSLFSLFGFWFLLDLIEKTPYLLEKTTDILRGISLISLTISLIYLCFASCNLRFLEFSKESLMQFQMKEIIERSNIKNPTIFSYKIGDPGINTVTGSIPNLQYFCHYYNDKFTEIAEEQEKCIKDQCADYIITITKWDYKYPTFDTYDHQGSLVGMADEVLEYYHYYTPKKR